MAQNREDKKNCATPWKYVYNWFVRCVKYESPYYLLIPYFPGVRGLCQGREETEAQLEGDVHRGEVH